MRRCPCARALLGVGPLVALTLGAATALASWPTDPHVNLAVPVGAPGGAGPSLAPDGLGGVYVSGLVGVGRPALQHVTSSGAVDPAWPVAGLGLGPAAPADTNAPLLVPDDAHGVIATWVDGACLRCSRVDLSGHVVAGWPDSGLALCSGDVPTAERRYAVTSDARGGVIVAWFDAGNPLRSVAAQRVVAAGFVPGSWPANFVTLHTGSDSLRSPSVIPDSFGGAILVWTDYYRGVGKIVGIRVVAEGAKDTNWGANGNVLCDGAGSQARASVIPDWAGSFFVAWQDERANPGQPLDDIYLQRLLSSGIPTPGWPAGGVVLCNAPGLQSEPSIALDDSGGVYAAWTDHRGADADVYGTRCMWNGAVQPGWPVNGLALCAAAQDQGPVRLTRDVTGGAIAAWTDLRSGSADQYAGRLQPRGAPDPAWTSNGVAVSLAPDAQAQPGVIADGAGGAIVAWADGRNASPPAVYAQRIGPGGVLGGDVVVGVFPAPGPPTARAAPILRVLPNPARRGVGTRLHLVLASPGVARLSVYDFRGRLVRLLAEGAWAAGAHDLRWDGRDAAGGEAPPGVYFIHVCVGEGKDAALTQRVVFVPGRD